MARRRFRRRTSRDVYRRMNLRCPFCGRENFLTGKGLSEHKRSCKAMPKSGRRHSYPMRPEAYKDWAEREWKRRRRKAARKGLPKKAKGGFEAWRSGPKKSRKRKASRKRKPSGPRVYVSKAATRAERMGISLNEYKRRQKRGSKRRRG